MKKIIETCKGTQIHPESVALVNEAMLEEKTYLDLSKFFQAFSDNTRIKILWALEINELCVCDLASVLKMTKSAISHQLRTLKELDLVKFRKEGKNVFYSLSDNHVKTILEQGLVHINEEK